MAFMAFSSLRFFDLRRPVRRSNRSDLLLKTLPRDRPLDNLPVDPTRLLGGVIG